MNSDGYGMQFLGHIPEGIYLIFLNSSAVEHSAVNRGVVGSSPTWGVSNLFLHTSGGEDAHPESTFVDKVRRDKQVLPLCGSSYLYIMAPWSSG